MLRRGDTGPAVVELQRLLVKLGAETLQVDGILGPITLAEAHRQLGLLSDDILTDKELVALRAKDPHPPLFPIRRVWAFADFSLPTPTQERAWVERIVGLHLTDVVFGCNSIEDQNFTLHLDKERIKTVAKALQIAGLSVHLMTWMRPRAGYIEAAAAFLGPLCQEINAASLLFDCEGPWVTTFEAHKDEALRSFDRSFLKPWRVPLGVTSYADLPAQVTPLLSRVDYALPQAYSTWTDQSWTHLPQYAPGSMQERATSHWQPYCPRLVMGLACYSQTRPDMDQKAAMETAIDACRGLKISEVAYWSLKWLSGGPSAEERAGVVRAIQGI